MDKLIHQTVRQFEIISTVLVLSLSPQAFSAPLALPPPPNCEKVYKKAAAPEVVLPQDPHQIAPELIAIAERKGFTQTPAWEKLKPYLQGLTMREFKNWRSTLEGTLKGNAEYFETAVNWALKTNAETGGAASQLGPKIEAYDAIIRLRKRSLYPFRDTLNELLTSAENGSKAQIAAQLGFDPGQLDPTQKAQVLRAYTVSKDGAPSLENLDQLAVSKKVLAMEQFSEMKKQLGVDQMTIDQWQKMQDQLLTKDLSAVYSEVASRSQKLLSEIRSTLRIPNASTDPEGAIRLLRQAATEKEGIPWGGNDPALEYHSLKHPIWVKYGEEGKPFVLKGQSVDPYVFYRNAMKVVADPHLKVESEAGRSPGFTSFVFTGIVDQKQVKLVITVDTEGAARVTTSFARD